MPEIRQLNASDKNFWQQLDAVLAWEQSADSGVAAIVTNILADVKKRGDAAVLEYTKKLDRLDVSSADQLELSQATLQKALNAIDTKHRDALEIAAERVRAYAQHQKMESWSYTEADGTVLGQKITPWTGQGCTFPVAKPPIPHPCS